MTYYRKHEIKTPPIASAAKAMTLLASNGCPPLLVFDTETTSLSSDGRVVSTAGVWDVKPDDGKEYRFCVPDGALVDPSAFEVNGLSRETLANEPPIAPFIKGFALQLEHCATAAWNADFDLRMLACEAHRAGVPLRHSAKNPNLCLKKVAQKVWPEAPSHSLNKLADWLKVGYTDLQLHRALDDVRLTLRVLSLMRAKLALNAGETTQ